VISGAHVIVYSRDADADRAFLRDVLGLPATDVGGGWLIFALPPSEVAVHPHEKNDLHELFLLVNDVDAFMATMRRRGVACSAISEQSWGRLTKVTLPGGGTLAVYQPKHERSSA
jgi:catechol 2,3-dioxygenase-like lactoylglutathione lyase family enzyme